MSLVKPITISELKPTQSTFRKNIFLEDQRREIATYISQVLIDTFSAYVMTLQFHWNIQGGRFYSLHKMFAEQYKELGSSLDEITERIRSLGFLPPSSLGDFNGGTTFPDEENKAVYPQTMIRQLCESHTKVVSQCKDAIDIANEYKDYATADLLVKRMANHEKVIWMLRSSIDN